MTVRTWGKRAPLSTHPAAVSSRKRRKRLLRAARRHLGGTHCHYCGLRTAARQLQFHHIYPETKVANVTTLAGRAALDVFWAEVAKCVLTCKYCHALQHNPIEEDHPDDNGVPF